MKKVKEIRKEKGIAAKWVAEQLEITPTSYCNKESGRTNFKITEAIRLCQILGVDINEVEF